jgi:uncharacterized protein (DUF2267 family)
MDFEFVVDHVKAEVGLERRADAERAVAEFLEVLGGALDKETADALALRLPVEVRPVLGADHPQSPDEDLDALVTHLSEHMQLDPAVARHIAVAAGTAIGTELDEHARNVLDRHLHPSIAALFSPVRYEEHAPA